MAARDCSTIAMVAGGEARHPTVISRGEVLDWVGTDWITLRRATAAYRKQYPTVVYKD